MPALRASCACELHQSLFEQRLVGHLQRGDALITDHPIARRYHAGDVETPASDIAQVAWIAHPVRRNIARDEFGGNAPPPVPDSIDARRSDVRLPESQPRPSRRPQRRATADTRSSGVAPISRRCRCTHLTVDLGPIRSCPRWWACRRPPLGRRTRPLGYRNTADQTQRRRLRVLGGRRRSVGPPLSDRSSDLPTERPTAVRNLGVPFRDGFEGACRMRNDPCGDVAASPTRNPRLRFSMAAEFPHQGNSQKAARELSRRRMADGCGRMTFRLPHQAFLGPASRRALAGVGMTLGIDNRRRPYMAVEYRCRNTRR